ncbi:EamA family transporter [Thermophilibacter mediterraneus]|uniref:EamA family transporter n=1 Tax=Thermophilibacter mediterraneus TaxID=1871031 RepID=UPI000930FB50|nr:EamA family transporter [Thermophilibacter mediterraneus]
MSEKRTSIVWALLAAALYAISSPVSKLLLREVEPTMMAALLYLGAGLGMLLLGIVRRRLGLGASEQRLTRRDLPYTVGMIVLDVAAPICLMIGLTSTTSANASLLNNFEIVATSLIARYRQDSCALSDSPIGPPSGAATRPAASRPGSGGSPTRSRRRT